MGAVQCERVIYKGYRRRCYKGALISYLPQFLKQVANSRIQSKKHFKFGKASRGLVSHKRERDAQKIRIMINNWRRFVFLFLFAFLLLLSTSPQSEY